MSSNNLTKIREMATSVKNTLASLTIKPDALDEIDSVAGQRVMLREKLATLEAAETVERERLVAEEKKQKGKKRRSALVELAETSEQLVAKHTELTERATKLISELVTVIIERERVFTKETTGLSDPIFSELFTGEETNNLTYEMQRSALSIYSGDFGKTYENEVNEQCSENNNLRMKLLELVTRANEFHQPLKPASPLLVKAAKALQFKPVPEPKTTQTETMEAKKPGTHQVADMRNPGPVIEL